MIYFIATEIKGITYYVNAPGVVDRKTTIFTFEGLQNNATEFYSHADATRVMNNLISKHNLNVIPKDKKRK